MSMLYPYGDQSDPAPEDPYPYEDYYGHGSGRPPRRCRRNRGGWWLLLLLVVVIGGVVAVLSRFSVNLRQTSSGVTLSIQSPSSSTSDEETQVMEAAGDDLAVLQPSGDSTGSGAQLMVTETPGPLPETPSDGGQGLSLQAIYRKCIPSVVSIISTQRSGSTTGTGIIMSEDGYIITNDHVIDGAVAIEVLTSLEETYPASLVGSDATSDLAVLKIDAKGLTAAEFGDSNTMEVGDMVVAIGDPLGTELRGTMTDGIISAINRDLTVNGRTMTLLQTNAALNNGNSGGPLINAYGQVIGINTMKMSSYYTSTSVEGLGFAIPIATAKPIIDELIEQGYISGRPAIGINTRDLPAAVRVYYGIPEGVYVDTVDPSSDAYAQGLRQGDTITAIEGIAVSNSEDLEMVKNQYTAGQTVELTVYRNGKYYAVSIQLMDASGL